MDPSACARRTFKTCRCGDTPSSAHALSQAANEKDKIKGFAFGTGMLVLADIHMLYIEVSGSWWKYTLEGKERAM